MLAISMILALVLFDQWTKYYIVSNFNLYQSKPIIENFFHLTYITNDGMAFGINFPFGIYVFSTISLIFTVFLFWYLWTIKEDGIVIRTGVALIIAGAVGNLIDRIFLGSVVDFLDFMIGNYHWYVFNFADSYVTVGMGFILYDSFFLEPKKENK